MRAPIKALTALSLGIALGASTGAAATRDAQPPDREMLKMLEFLRDMEMIKQMEMLQDMHRLENGETKTAAPQKTVPAKKKETVK